MRAGWERDAAVSRVSTLTRAAVAGSVALSVAFTAVVAWAQPGRTKAAAGRPGGAAPVTPRAAAASGGSDETQATLAPDSGASNTVSSNTVPPAYTPQPYAGSGGGGIVSGQS